MNDSGSGSLNSDVLGHQLSRFKVGPGEFSGNVYYCLCQNDSLRLLLHTSGKQCCNSIIPPTFQGLREIVK